MFDFPEIVYVFSGVLATFVALGSTGVHELKACYLLVLFSFFNDSAKIKFALQAGTRGQK